MIFIVSILVEMQLDDVFQLQRLPRDRVLLELLDIRYNVCNVIDSAISCARLHMHKAKLMSAKLYVAFMPRCNNINL